MVRQDCRGGKGRFPPKLPPSPISNKPREFGGKRAFDEKGASSPSLALVISGGKREGGRLKPTSLASVQGDGKSWGDVGRPPKTWEFPARRNTLISQFETPVPLAEEGKKLDTAPIVQAEKRPMKGAYMGYSIKTNPFVVSREGKEKRRRPKEDGGKKPTVRESLDKRRRIQNSFSGGRKKGGT